MNILVLGGGGREHALAWKIQQSPECKRIFLHPGNPGTHHQNIPSLRDIHLDDRESLIAESKKHSIELVVIGPENLLERGYADAFRDAGFLVVGPNREAARLETSKVFAKEFMQRAGIPTAPFFVADNKTSLLTNIQNTEWPIVLKLDGLAAGKGVVIAKTLDDVEAFATKVWEEKAFGPAPQRVLVESFLEGTELSYIGLCDGTTFLPLPTATDFKRVGEGDSGPNTGGMGAISPSPYLTPRIEALIQKELVGRFLAQLEKEKINYRGALYFGVMLRNGNPYVLEFNTRFGDPETQATLIRMKNDLLSALVATASGTLSQSNRMTPKELASIYLVGASEGYPTQAKTGDPIEFLEPLDKDIQVFYSGVSKNGVGLKTAGGRVLGIGCSEPSLREARHKIYENMQKIRWRGMHYRGDIGEEK